MIISEIFQDEPLEVRARQDSQGSYVEMSPHTEGEVSPEEGQYFCMDNTKLSSSRLAAHKATRRNHTWLIILSYIL